MQGAFVFAKPHANTHAVQELIRSKFSDVGVVIESEGEITGEAIDAKGHIDQHYYAIASKATIMKPAELNVPTEKFSAFFGEEWATVLAEGRAFNAIDMKAKLGGDDAKFEALWDATNDGKRIKFGGGFYCGCIEVEGTKFYTFNAFFMSMRGKFTEPGSSIHYFVVSFDPSKLSWADFRGKVLGPTDPASAPEGSLRGVINAAWERLGLDEPPNTGNNGVHASASPFEGFAERLNWLGVSSVADDPFGQRLLAEGVPEEMLKAWTVDPQVLLPDGSGTKGSLFDQLEDLDLEECVAACKAIAAAQQVAA